MTTKAQIKAQQIEARKFQAFAAKVRTLAGYAYAKQAISDEAVQAAYDAGQTADQVAVEVVSREPVGLAVFPLKSAAVDRAERLARQKVANVMAELAANGWDLLACAPYPARNAPNRDAALAKWQLFRSLVRHLKSVRSFMDTTDIVEPSEGAIERYVALNCQSAADQYDSFVIKLVSKIGEGVVDAKLAGDHVWAESTLTVNKADGSVEFWRTQQIVNVSKLGLLFNQWPTRKVKR